MLVSKYSLLLHFLTIELFFGSILSYAKHKDVSNVMTKKKVFIEALLDISYLN